MSYDGSKLKVRVQLVSGVPQCAISQLDGAVQSELSPMSDDHAAGLTPAPIATIQYFGASPAATA